MKRFLALVISALMLFSSFACADTPSFAGVWATAAKSSADSTVFIMFRLKEDGTALYSYQMYFSDHPGMTEKAFFTWRNTPNDTFVLIDNEGKYRSTFYMIDDDHISNGGNAVYTRLPLLSLEDD